MFGIAALLPPILGPGAIQHPAFVIGSHDYEAGAGIYNTTADTGIWLNSTDNGGTVKVVDAAPYGVVRLLPGTGAGDYVSIQLNGEPFALAKGRRLIFQTKIRTNDSDDIKFAIGFSTTDASTGATAGPVLDGTTNFVGFRNAAGNTTAFTAVTEDDTNETVTNAVGQLADNEWAVLTVEVIGHDRVNFYVNGQLVAKHTTNLPDEGDALTLTFEVGSPTGTTATYLDRDYWIVAMDGEAV